MLQDKAAALKQDEREGGRSRRWRGQLVKLNHLVSLLEADQEELEKVFPQVPPPSPPPPSRARARGGWGANKRRHPAWIQHCKTPGCDKAFDDACE